MDDELLLEFINEAREHLATIESDLLTIEEAGSVVDEQLINKVFRAAHSIKGGSGFFGLEKVKELAHKTETVLDMMRSGKIIPNAEVTNILLGAFDTLREMINNTAESEHRDVSDLIVNLAGLASSYLPPQQKASLHDCITFTPSHGTEVSLLKVDVDRCRRTGQRIYLVDCDLLHDVEGKGVDMMDLFRTLTASGEILDCQMDTESMGTLDDPIGNNIPLRIVVASAVEQSCLGEMLFAISPDKIELLMNSELPGQSIKSNTENSNVNPNEKGNQSVQDDVKISEPVLPQKTEQVNPIESLSQKSKTLPPVQSSAHEDTLRVNVGLLETLMNLAGELVLSRNQLHSAVIQNNHTLLTSVEQRVNQVTTEIQDVIMQTRLQPIGNVFSKFPRVVRDLSHALGKEIELDIRGKDVALDKTLIEGLSDPLIHMVRNAVDHGIETKEDRIRVGKKPIGQVRIEARHEAGQVVVEIADDGKGLDPEKIANAAVSKGLIAPEKAASMSVREKQALIFLPGLSTAKVVSDVSGRGVGMDVVKTNLDKLGGQIEIVSEIGKGSSFVIKLPLTLAIIPSLIVSAGNERFALPQANIEELLRLRPNDISSRIETVGDSEVLLLRDRIIPLARFNRFLNASAAAGIESNRSAMEIAVVSSGRLSFALVVDAFHDTEEIVVKPLGSRLKHLREYSGATILGDGAVALILDMAGLSAKTGLAAAAEAAHQMQEQKALQEQRRLRDLQSLLLFYNGTQEPCAVPLDLVQRIERIAKQQIECKGSCRTMQYCGGSLPLITLADAAKAAAIEEENNFVVLVCSAYGRDIGLLGTMPVDVLEIETAIDQNTHRQKGVAGSAIINGQTTLIVDLYEMVEAVYPNWAAAAKDTKSKACPAPADTPPHSGCFQDDVADSPVGSKVTVLLAEDSDFFRGQVKKYLEEDGFRVLDAPDGQAAWELLLKNTDTVNVVVTDVEMPHLTGLGLAQRIRADNRTAHLPIIAVTSLAGNEDMEKGKAAGVNDYQIKLDKDKLLESVHAMAGTAV